MNLLNSRPILRREVMFPISLDNDPLSSLEAKSTYCKDEMLKKLAGKEPLNLLELMPKLSKLISPPISSGIFPAWNGINVN